MAFARKKGSRFIEAAQLLPSTLILRRNVSRNRFLRSLEGFRILRREKCLLKLYLLKRILDGSRRKAAKYNGGKS
jgi:hypothetical protein